MGRRTHSFHVEFFRIRELLIKFISIPSFSIDFLCSLRYLTLYMNFQDDYKINENFYNSTENPHNADVVSPINQKKAVIYNFIGRSILISGQIENLCIFRQIICSKLLFPSDYTLDIIREIN